MREETLRDLPGAEIVFAGIADIEAGRESVNACAVLSAVSRFVRAGLPVRADDGDIPPAHRLYEQLSQELGDGAHARYNAILERVASFAGAAEIARPC